MLIHLGAFGQPPLASLQALKALQAKVGSCNIERGLHCCPCFSKFWCFKVYVYATSRFTTQHV